MGMVSNHLPLGDELAFSNSRLIRDVLDLAGGPQRERIRFCFYHVLLSKNVNSFLFQHPMGNGLCYGPNRVCPTPAASLGK